ncbi:MAG: L,D-transpeptidase family protein [bacterium]|nr:L,D-transpeptidase family protein [bacterium]
MMILGRSLFLGVLAIGSLVATVAGAAGFSSTSDRNPTTLEERRLMQGLFDIRQGRIENAIRNIAYLVEQEPEFRLAQLVYADLLSAHTAPLADLGNGSPSELIDGHVQEARARLLRYLEAPPPNSVPRQLLRIPPSTPAAIFIDLSAYRLYVLEQREGRFVRTKDFYVSIGKGGGEKRFEGDEKTPVGVYLVASYLPGERLPDLYGDGAFPINYPNAWDRLNGRTGSGIWIHGTESAYYSRPPLSSRGCVTLSNQDFRVLRRQVEVSKTPVIVADRINWVDPETVSSARDVLETTLETWRADWESRNSDRYLSHYAADFRTPGMDLDAFARHKRSVNASKKYIRVGLDEVGIYRYPGEPDLALVDFLQRYESDNFRASRRKHQYWRRDGSRWRIIYEEGL